MKQPTIYHYATDPNLDLLIVKWWMRMREDDELEAVFFKSLHPLSAFMENWKTPGLMLEIDDQGITAAMWVTNYMSAAVIGLYIRPDKRHSIGTLRAVLNMYRMIFDAGCKSVIGITKQAALVTEHERLGYTVLGCVPGIYDGADGYVVVLTAEAFMSRWGSEHAVETAAESAFAAALQ